MVLCIQANPCRTHGQLQLSRFLPQLNKSRSSQTPSTVLRPAAKYLPVLMLQQYNLSAKYPRRSHVCLLGGNENPQGENESLENAFGSFKGKSLEDVLREQMSQNNEEFDEGGIGDFPPRDGSGGSGGGDGFQGPQDEDLPGRLDETLQVVLASVGFFFVYRYILDGERMMRIVKDYFKFLFTGKKSIRLGKAFDEWEELWEEVSGVWLSIMPRRKTIVKDDLWLERQIMRTPTWFDSGRKYKRLYRGNAQGSNGGKKSIKAPRDNNDDDYGDYDNDYVDDYY